MVEGESRAAGHDAPPSDPLLGKVLNGRFTILETLGSGGMGKVYKAMQAPLDRVVALKVLNPHYGSGKDPGFQKRFFLEASLTSKLHHPNTITVIDYGKTDDGIFYIAMEFVEGVTLARVIADNGALPWPRALHIAQQICRSLREAHKIGIIHRDLKPANVMVLSEETDHDLVKVLDFGLVKSLLPEGKSSNETELTQAGVLLGSPMYMAPEQARNHADVRSDVYSMGVVFYQMVTGTPPFRAKDAIDVIVQHVNQAPPPLLTTNPQIQVPPEVESLIFKCLAKKPEDRFQSMDQLLEAMRSAGANLGLSGVFSRPRAFTTPGGTSSAAVSAVLDVQVDDGTATRADAPSALSALDDGPTAATGKGWKVGGLVAALAIAGLGIFWMVNRSGAPPVTAAPRTAPGPVSTPHATGTPPVAPRPPPVLPRTVRIRVISDPLGATVSQGANELGRTPFHFEVPKGAETTLTFSLEGYQRVSVVTQGTGSDVVVNQKLVPVPAPVIRKKEKARPKTGPKPGYKDDPY